MRVLGWTSRAALLSVVLTAHAPIPAAAQAWDLEGSLAGLSALEPAPRAKAALALGQAWPEGCQLATVLAEMALEDEDASVRSAARESVATLAGRALVTWAELLRTEKALADTPFHAHAKAWNERAVTRPRTTELVRALEAANGDDVEHGILGALPLLFAARTVGSYGAQGGLTLVLFDRVARGGARARALALAGLALWGSALLRDAGVAPPATSPPPPDVVALLVSLLSDARPWMQAVAASVLGSGAPADPVTARVLGARLQTALQAEAKDGAGGDAARRAGRSEPLLCALRRLGPAAKPPIAALRSASEAHLPGAIEALVRLGERERLLPEEPSVLEARIERKPAEVFADARPVIEYLAAVGELALVDPALARPAARSVTLLVQEDHDLRFLHLEMPALRQAGLHVRGDLGPLSQEEARMLDFLLFKPTLALDLAIRVMRGKLGIDPAKACNALLNAPPGHRFMALGGEVPSRLALRRLAREAVRTAMLPENMWAEEPPLSPISMGLLWGLTESPEAARLWVVRLQRLLEGAHANAPLLHDTAFFAAMRAGVADEDPAPEPPVVLACEARRLAVRALMSAGPRAKSTLRTLDLFRNDPDLHLRWAALRARGAIEWP